MGEKREKIKNFLLFLLSHHDEEQYSRTLKITDSVRLCARCTGMVIGFISLLIVNIFFIPYLSWPIALTLMLLMIIPALVDWLTQKFRKRESNNSLRVITGFLLGASITFMIHMREIFLFVNILIFSMLFVILLIIFKVN